MIDRDAVLDAYAQTLFWTMSDSEANSYPDREGKAFADIPEHYRGEIAADVDDFLHLVAEEFGEGFDFEGRDAAAIGHDLYLTVARHGAGFWDGGYPQSYTRNHVPGTWGDWTHWRPGDDGHETSTLGDILTRIARTISAPIVEIQDEDGKWWVA